MKIYKYDTEIQAISAVKACNLYYRIPKSENDTTQNWCSYTFYNNFFYINFDESLIPILGQPIEMEIENIEMT